MTTPVPGTDVVIILFPIIINNLLNCGNDALYVLVRHHRVERNAHDALVDALGDWAEAAFVAHLLIEREEVDRYVVHLALDILGAHGIEELTACAGQLIKF